ncbi:hypothetical protein ACFLSZ_02400 [Candidatus Bipolaricaulota bacterium]
MGFLIFLWIIFSLALAAWVIIKAFFQTAHVAVEAAIDASGRVTVLTSAENKLPIAKRVGFAFLLIGPEGESPIVTAQAVAADTKLKDDHNLHISRFYVFRQVTYLAGSGFQSLTDGSGRWLIPLPFYYDERDSVTAEKLTYRCPVDSSGFASGTTHSVRFYMYSQPLPFLPRRLYRSVQDLLVASG